MAGQQNSQYKLNYSRRRFSDVDIQQQLRRELPGRQDLLYEEVDFSQNELSSSGLRAVLDVCRRCPKLRILKLYKNQIDDGGAEGLADLCRHIPGIEEIHLSHNHFTAVGVEVLITAAEQARPANISPLWLRLEQNDVGDAATVLENLQSRLAVCSRQDEVRCTVRQCCKRQKVHLPFFTLQRPNRVDRSRGGYPRDIREEASPTAAVAPSRSVVTPKHGLTPSNRVQLPNGSNSVWHNGTARQFGDGAPFGSPQSTRGGDTPGFEAFTDKSPSFGGPSPSSRGSSDAAAAAALDTAMRRSREAAGAAEVDMSPTPARQRGGGSAGTGAGSGGGATPSGGGGNTGGGSKASEEASYTQTPKHDAQSRLRPSLVLDDGGHRRILPKQLEVEGGSNHLVCPQCHFVIMRPVITTCSHLFCDSCFCAWVKNQVSKQKKGVPEGPVQYIPCPYPNCTAKLQKKDIMRMDKASPDSSKVGAVPLLQRLRNNLRVRCVHHRDHFKYDFGKDAERVQRETGMTCKWIGDLAAYEEHVGKGCAIESLLGGNPAAKQTERGATSGGDGTGAAQNDGGEVRVARYDYVPRETDKAQIALRTNDLVKIFDVTASGWAAGVRLCKETRKEVGEAGWFPEGYLYPADSGPAS